MKLHKGVNLLTLERSAQDQGAVNLDYIELHTGGAAAAPSVRNGGFETGGIDGWKEWHPAGQTPAYGVDGYDVYAGNGKLYFWSMQPYKQSVHQLLTGLETGTYTVNALVKETVYGETPQTVRMELASYGGSAEYSDIGPSAGYRLVSSTVQVTNGRLDIGFYIDSPGRTSVQIDNVSIVRQ